MHCYVSLFIIFIFYNNIKRVIKITSKIDRQNYINVNLCSIRESINVDLCSIRDSINVNVSPGPQLLSRQGGITSVSCRLPEENQQARLRCYSGI
jgi:hypothetical protein